MKHLADVSTHSCFLGSTQHASLSSHAMKLHHTSYHLTATCLHAGQHSGNSKPSNEAAQKSLDRRAAHLILRGARELLTTRAADLKAQAAQFHQVLGATPGPGAHAGHSPNSTQKTTPVTLPPLPSPLTSPTATPVVLPKEVWHHLQLLSVGYAHCQLCMCSWSPLSVVSCAPGHH